ncbi:hypothetical protein K1719_032135 [Acacia pycnantha]|nr:hypothetical protein K1719_032135 [Acacia pycnantha]
MENDHLNSGNKHAKKVQLDLNTSVTTQKGRALVGRLETDKFLNKGVVISMIKKGWSLDKNMEIHDMPEKNAYLFRFANADDYNRVLKGHRAGNGLGTVQVKPIDEVVVIHDPTWDEAAVVRRKSAEATGPAQDYRRIDGVAITGKSISQGVNHGEQMLSNKVNPNGKEYIEDASNAHLQGDFLFPISPKIRGWIPEGQLNIPESAPPHKPQIREIVSINSSILLVAEIQAENQVFNAPIPTSMANQSSPTRILSTQSAPYRVESPASKNEGKSALTPIVGLSPVTAVTTGLRLINLKQLPDPLDEAQRPNPPKKRLTYIEEQVPTAPICDNREAIPSGPQRLNVQKMKKEIHNKKKKAHA